MFYSIFQIYCRVDFVLTLILLSIREYKSLLFLKNYAQEILEYISTQSKTILTLQPNTLLRILSSMLCNYHVQHQKLDIYLYQVSFQQTQ